MNTVEHSTDRALTRRLAMEQAQGRLPSLAAALVRDGRIAWFGARGQVQGRPPTPDTQYRIGSITKSVVAVAVLRLRDEGLVDLLDPLDKHLPGSAAGDLSLAQLLSHTAGLSAEPPGPWWERTPGVPTAELVAGLDAETLKHRPGRRFHYSNTGFALLGEVVARKRGMPWQEVVRQEILLPLDMNATTPRPRAPHASGYAVHPWADVLLPEPEHDAGAMAPAGQLWCTATDLARWAAFMAGDTGDVLREATLAEMREPAAVEDGPAWTRGYGLGVQVARHNGRSLVGHSGSMPGFICSMWADPADALGVLYLANATSTSSTHPLLMDMLDIMDTLEPALPREWTPAPADPDLLALTGPWYWGPAAYLLRLLPGPALSLAPVTGAGRSSRFTPRADGTWLGLDGYYAGETLRVVPHPGGVHLDLNTFIFTREPYDPAAPLPGGIDPMGWR